MTDFLEEYVTYEDISQLIGVPVPTLYTWKARGKLPEPDYMFRQPLWKAETIDMWARKEGLL